MVSTGWEKLQALAAEGAVAAAALGAPPAPVSSRGPFRYLAEIGPGFWNLRGSFKLALVDIGNHMSFLRLGDGKILVIDALGTYSTKPKVAEAVRREIAVLTDGGRNMAAVVFTHPFHTGGVEPFHEAYPEVPMYGAPRHLKRFPGLPWAGVLTDEAVRARWEPAVSMQIPAGTEFVDPKPPASNHLSTCIVFHRESRTLHADDFFQYYDHIWERMGKVAWGIAKLIGINNGTLAFHPSLLGAGLRGNPEAPSACISFVQDMCCRWDFENLCTAHNDVLHGNARGRVLALLESMRPQLESLAAKLAKGQKFPPVETSHMWGQNDQETECG